MLTCVLPSMSSMCQHITYFAFQFECTHTHTQSPPQGSEAMVITSGDDAEESSGHVEASDADETTDEPDSEVVHPFQNFQLLFTPQCSTFADPSVDLGKIEPDDDSDDLDYTPNDDDDLDVDDSDMDDDDSDMDEGDSDSDMDDDEDVNLGLGVLDGGEINLERCSTRGFGIQLAAARGAPYPQHIPRPGQWSYPVGYKDHAYSLHFLEDGIPKHPFRYAGPATPCNQSVHPHMDVSTILWLLCMGAHEGSGCGGQEGPDSKLVSFFASELCDTALLTEMTTFLYSPGFRSVCTLPSDERREYSFSTMDGPGVKRRGRWDIINQKRLIDREQKEGYM